MNGLMKKLAGAGLVAGGIAWWLYRDRKYPLAKGYGAVNKVVIPGALVNEHTAKLANRIIGFRAMPKVSEGLLRNRLAIQTRDNKEIQLTVYTLQNVQEKLPCLVYFHGGGFFLKDDAYIHKIVMQYAQHAKCTVVFVHYRTADVYPFPTPFYDCADAVEYVYAHADELHIDKGRIAVGGDSAGGALAAGVAHYCKDHAIPLCFEMLLYPVLDQRMKTASAVNYTDAPMWNSTMSKRMWALYLKDGMHEKEAYCSPACADDFHGLPPAYIEIGEFDSLHDEGIHYAKALRKCDVPVVVAELKGGFHGFDFFENTSLTKQAMKTRCEVLYHAFWN